MREMTLETFYIINQIPKINRTHWNLPWMSCILKYRSLKISLETLERSFHREEKTETSREASWDIWNSPLCNVHSWCTDNTYTYTVLQDPSLIVNWSKRAQLNHKKCLLKDLQRVVSCKFMGSGFLLCYGLPSYLNSARLFWPIRRQM